jgi:hypothetical protein
VLLAARKLAVPRIISPPSRNFERVFMRPAVLLKWDAVR